MQKIFTKTLCAILTFIILSQVAFAEIDTNIDGGGGGGLGEGSNDNGWAISSTGGGLIYDADGLRAYIVNSSTGIPVSAAIDFTNYNVGRENVRNCNYKTKFNYKHVSDSLNFSTTYNYTKIETSDKLPRIISNTMNASSSADRIEAIKDWFTNIDYFSWIISTFGYNLEAMNANGYKLAIEPIAYFRYQGYNYAMTAIEAALFDKLSSGGLSSKLAPLTRQNLPLAIFLEDDEFINSSYRINAWSGTRNSYVSNDDIIRQLGIGFISSSDSEERIESEGNADFSYPTDTWVITPFRICNVQYYDGDFRDYQHF